METIRKKYSELTVKDKRNIIDQFTTKTNNSVPAISNELQITASAVSRVINDHLEFKRKGFDNEPHFKLHTIRTKKGVEHQAYIKEIKGKVYFVASNHTTKFIPSKVTIINK